MTLHLSFPFRYKSRYKSSFWKLSYGPLEAWSPCVILSFLSFLSLSLLLSGGLLGVQGLSEFTFFFAWASKTRLERHPASSPGMRPHPIEKAPADSVNRASSVSGALLAFCVNQWRSSLFLSPFTFLIAYTIILRDFLDPAGAGPQHRETKLRWARPIALF